LRDAKTQFLATMSVDSNHPQIKENSPQSWLIFVVLKNTFGPINVIKSTAKLRSYENQGHSG
jgi:hypothetical protein